MLFILEKLGNFICLHFLPFSLADFINNALRFRLSKEANKTCLDFLKSFARPWAFFAEPFLELLDRKTALDGFVVGGSLINGCCGEGWLG